MAIASLGEITAKKLQTSTMSKLTEQMTAGNKSYMAETVTRSEFKKSNRVSDIPIFIVSLLCSPNDYITMPSKIKL